MGTEALHGAEVPTEAMGFHTTHWTEVWAAGQADSPQTATALERLCRAYWPPLYAYIRRQGYSPELAQDMTQEFFAQFLEKRDFTRASPEKGHFRSFLLVMLKHFLINEWHRARCQKRGGGRVVLSLDAGQIEARYQLELVETATPERLFERHWALTVLDRAMDRVRQEYAAAGKGDLFQLLKETLSGEKRTTLRAELAARCGVSVGAVDVAVHRLRRRYGEALRDEIRQTVSQPGEVEEEIRHLRAVLRQG